MFTDCERCNELHELVAELTRQLVDRSNVDARLARAVLDVQRHTAGICCSLEAVTTGLTGMEPNGREPL